VFIGAFLGSGLFGFLCDTWGRRKPLFLATALVAVTMFAGLAAPTYWVMAALRGVAGVGAAGQSHTVALLCTEPVGPGYRCAIALLPF
jgi:MFS family permease